MSAIPVGTNLKLIQQSIVRTDQISIVSQGNGMSPDDAVLGGTS
jgi:hypothetical protein